MNWWMVLIPATALTVVFLWKRFRPIVISAIGFDWEKEGFLFEEAAERASKAIGRRVVVRPTNGGVGMLVSNNVRLAQLQVPTTKIDLSPVATESVARIASAIRSVVAVWETHRSNRLFF